VTDWANEIDAVLVPGFGGLVSLGSLDSAEFERGYGLADRAHQVPFTPDTRFAIASGTKGFTALVVASLVADGTLSLGTTARSVLGDDLPLIAGDVTVEHLLNHTSGIGDYVDEEADEVPLKVPVYELVDTEDYLPALDGVASKFATGAGFSYCNSGYVVLALIAERVSGHGFHELVSERVLAPAGMHQTSFLRSDALPGDAAIGYLKDGRTNVFALPVRGNGDGGAYTTVADVRRFWAALDTGRIVASEWAARAMSPQSGGPPHSERHYGWGVWVSDPVVMLEGGDHGVSFRSAFDRSSGRVWTATANANGTIGPVLARLHELLF
jgi:CubicO group peptidase (beta-lactamase class C family)